MTTTTGTTNNTIAEWSLDAGDSNSATVDSRRNSNVGSSESPEATSKSTPSSSFGGSMFQLYDGEYFEIVKRENDLLFVRCQMCGPDTAPLRSSAKSNGNILKHIRRRHPEILQRIRDTKNIKARTFIGHKNAAGTMPGSFELVYMNENFEATINEAVGFFKHNKPPSTSSNQHANSSNRNNDGGGDYPTNAAHIRIHMPITMSPTTTTEQQQRQLVPPSSTDKLNTVIDQYLRAGSSQTENGTATVDRTTTAARPPMASLHGQTLRRAPKRQRRSNATSTHHSVDAVKVLDYTGEYENFVHQHALQEDPIAPGMVTESANTLSDGIDHSNVNDDDNEDDDGQLLIRIGGRPRAAETIQRQTTAMATNGIGNGHEEGVVAEQSRDANEYVMTEEMCDDDVEANDDDDNVEDVDDVDDDDVDYVSNAIGRRYATGQPALDNNREILALRMQLMRREFELVEQRYKMQMENMQQLHRLEVERMLREKDFRQDQHERTMQRLERRLRGK